MPGELEGQLPPIVIPDGSDTLGECGKHNFEFVLSGVHDILVQYVGVSLVPSRPRCSEAEPRDLKFERCQTRGIINEGNPCESWR